MKPVRAATLWACIFPVSSALAQSIASTTQPAVSGLLPQVTLASLSDVKVSSYVSEKAIRSYPISTLPLNSPPIAGFSPQVVYGLTQERLNGYSDQDAIPASTMGTPPLPSTGQKFSTAILDSGSQSHLISNSDAGSLGFNLAGANLIGSNTAQVVGLTDEPEDTNITEPLGVYASGFGSASVNGSGTISAGTTIFTGQTNTSVLAAESGSTLPSVIGIPMMAEYRATIKNSQPQHLTVGTQTLRSPQVEFGALGSSGPAGYGTIALTKVPVGFFSLVTTPPTYFQNDIFSPDIVLPTNWYSLLATVNLSSGGGTDTGKKFLFDTGAQVSVVSVQVAQDLGYTEGVSAPDFQVDVTGVGGTLTVNGFYADSMSISLNTVWHHVPLLVLNLPNPDADNTGQDYLDGVLGMNLFTDRDISLNGTPSFIGFSQQWQWNNSNGGTWGTSANWTLALPNGIDTQANFYGAITSPKTITVDSGGFAVGTINFDNANRYTINGPGTITLAVSVDQAQINVSTGSHTINAPMALANDTTVTVWPPGGRLTITSDVNAGTHMIYKEGPGVLEMKNVRAGGLSVDEGTVMITANGGTGSTSRVSSLLFNPASTLTTATAGHLDLTNNSMVIDYTSQSPLPTIRQYLINGYNGGGWNGDNGIESSMANSTTFALGSAEKSALGLTSFAGQSLSGPAVLIKYTYYGDANLDGRVDVADLLLTAQHWNTSGDVWTGGDFNYDGVVDINDLRLLAQNWLGGISDPLAAPSLSQMLMQLGLPDIDVPEPEKLGTLAGLAMLLIGCSRLRPRVRRI